VRVSVADPTLTFNRQTNVSDWVSSAIMIDTARGVMRKIVDGWDYELDDFNIWSPDADYDNLVTTSDEGHRFAYSLQIWHQSDDDDDDDHKVQGFLYCRLFASAFCRYNTYFNPRSLIDVWRHLDGALVGEKTTKGLVKFTDYLVK